MKALALAILCACSSTSPPAPTAPPIPALRSGCPTSFDDAAGRHCAVDGKLAPPCAYAEGHCGCEVTMPCRGVVSLPPPNSEATWTCRPRVYPNGCPGEPPSGPCDHAPGDGCNYGTCGGVVMGCVDGQWKVTRANSPPP